MTFTFLKIIVTDDFTDFLRECRPRYFLCWPQRQRKIHQITAKGIEATPVGCRCHVIKVFASWSITSAALNQIKGDRKEAARGVLQGSRWGSHDAIAADGMLDTLWPQQNGRYFEDDIFVRIFMSGFRIAVDIPLTFVLEGLIGNKTTLVYVMAWCRQTTSHYINQCWPRSPLLCLHCAPCIFAIGDRWIPRTNGR